MEVCVMPSIGEQKKYLAAQRVRASQSVLTGWLDSLRPDTAVSWRDVDPESMVAAVAAITEAGHAITFGRTSDGGALSLTLLVAGTPHKVYPTSAGQAEDLLSRLAHTEPSDK